MTEISPAMPGDNGLVPGWLQRLAAVGWRLLATIALGLVLIYIAVLLGTVTASVLVAAIVAATFAPFVLALRDRGWSRIKAAAAVFVGAMAVIIATIVIIVIAFLPAITSVIDGITGGVARLKDVLASLDLPPEVGAAIDHATKGLQDWISERDLRAGQHRRHGRDRGDPGHLPDVLLHDGRGQGVGLGDVLGQELAARERSRPPATSPSSGSVATCAAPP